MAAENREPLPTDGDPLWYKDAIIYELHVRGFADSNDDGIGDFRGLTSKLDYIQELGVTAIWLLPFCPSPLRDAGYDTTDYTEVHADYGNMQDAQRFLREAHRRGLRVITELVLNHTSDQHPWFQRARRAKPGSPARDFYVWSATPDRYPDARIIFKDFETSNWSWDPVAKAYYWHRFYAHQPDLNFDNPQVRRAMFEAMDFWLELGVDGLRLDAVPYLYERDGTNCENLPETHEFLKSLRRHIDARYADRMLLAEANQWPEDAAAYFGAGEGCHMAFHFPLMPRLFMAIRLEQRFPIVEILQHTPAIPDTSQWAVFLRNHDELTLEMVSDEERDYMYRVYAGDPRMRVNLGIRRRLAPLLGNDRRKIELMNGLLLSMPGTPVLYYGDEIGMGDNIWLGDRNAVRTPMQWSADRNAGFSRANPQRLYLPVIIDPEFHYESSNVEAQQGNPSSILWWMRRIIGLRKRHKAFGRGSIEFLDPENRKILAFLREHEGETLLVVANLSRFTEYAELDLSRFAGRVPQELFGRTRFPAIGPQPYFVTLGPHSFYWFVLEPAELALELAPSARPALSEVAVEGSWLEALEPGSRPAASVEAQLPAWLAAQQWFAAAAHVLRSAAITDCVPIDKDTSVVIVQVDFADTEPERYVLFLAFAPGDPAGEAAPQALVRVREARSGRRGVVRDAASDALLSRVLLEAMWRRKRFRGTNGVLHAAAARAARRDPRLLGDLETSRLSERRRTTLRYGSQLFLKLFRRIEVGPHPELEIGRHLTEKVRFAHAAPLVGSIEYRIADQPMTLGILQGFAASECDAWSHTLESLGRYSERIQTLAPDAVAEPPRTYAELLRASPSGLGLEMMGTYWQFVQLLGERTAALHVALATDKGDPDFTPEPFTILYQRSIYQSMHSAAIRNLKRLRRGLAGLEEPVRRQAARITEREPEILQCLAILKERRLGGLRIRCHGNFHLGQVLYTGKDFVIVDFAGEPDQALGERRIRRSPLRDVGGMLLSLHAAACNALLVDREGEGRSAASAARFEPWVRFWSRWASAAFLQSYVPGARSRGLLPPVDEDLDLLLRTYVLDASLAEAGRDLASRNDRLPIPLHAISEILG